MHGARQESRRQGFPRITEEERTTGRHNRSRQGTAPVQEQKQREKQEMLKRGDSDPNLRKTPLHKVVLNSNTDLEEK